MYQHLNRKLKIGECIQKTPGISAGRFTLFPGWRWSVFFVPS
ncbi:hypothetical protein CHCC20335_0089 [Bacillus paralicheniformis]|nr:hypothetical protein CHCC20335_0089 [Bacillus paralicheniformis]